MKSYLIASLLVVLSTLRFLYADDRVTLSGTVTASGEALAAVNIRIAGTSFGTITNMKGEYTLRIEKGKQTIIFSSIGYQSDTLNLTLTENTTKDIRLTESPVKLAEVVISAEDPAIEIIRKAIAHKRTWMNQIKSYSFEAFSRQVLRSDTAIASITEAYSTGYMLAGDTLREVIKQRRQTENIPLGENFAAVRAIINFNEDRISLFKMRANDKTQAYTFVGPTAPDALDYYEYKLLGTSDANGIEIYKIEMTPKSRTTPLFSGIITIADVTFAVMGVDLVPNETFAIPFIKDISLRYSQQFSLYNDQFWMPTNIRITGGLSISIVGFSMPRIGIEGTSSIYNYSVNAPIPDSVLKKPSLVVDSSATKFDSTFWTQNNVLPLTGEEEQAYQTIDSTQTLDKQFEPKGPLATLGGSDATSVLGYLDVRFNRVEGFFLGGKYEPDTLTATTTARLSAGYGFSDTSFKYSAGGTIYTTPKRTLGFGADIYKRLSHVPGEEYYGSFFNSLTALIDQNDYPDYYMAKGWTIFMEYRPAKHLSSTFSFLSEKHSPVMNNTDYSFVTNSKSFRPNPPVTEGKMQSIAVALRLGDEQVPLGIIPRNAVELDVEHASPSFTGGNFDFTRYHATAEWTFTTFATDLLFPPKLSLKASAGTSSGILPPQRFFSLESQSSAYAPYGVLHGSRVKEFSGNRFAMLTVEHNFRSVPFLALDIPFLYKNSIELITFGSVAQTWNGTSSTSNGWYTEAGIGINRIFDVIRMDVTYRFTDPKRFYLTFSVANLF